MRGARKTFGPESKGPVRTLKRKVLSLLEGLRDVEGLYEGLRALPPRKLVSPLIGAFCHREERVRWLAILALGDTVARIAKEDLEAARIVIRRLMWMLNEESGGMAWGAPEALAECLYHHAGLAEEYTHILVSYIRPDGNMLEYPPAQRGVAWGIGRLSAKERKRLLQLRAQECLFPLLESPDHVVAGLTVWALGRLLPFPESERLKTPLERLRAEDSEIFFFEGPDFRWARVSELTAEVLSLLSV